MKCTTDARVSGSAQQNAARNPPSIIKTTYAYSGRLATSISNISSPALQLI
ncbi:hypothetical protein [Schleiferia thermophila]|uniref:hypothetical protein n=1 Tax=Schleiferia thermophila TaxID=884107 RepID=UPI0013647D6F|nr:hypothetical protein [Schleiferia thermophila]